MKLFSFVRKSDTLVLQNVSKNSKISNIAKIGYVSVTKRVQIHTKEIQT